MRGFFILRRIIICDLCTFPRGGARSNYLQYFADALTIEGYYVELFMGINKEYSHDNEFVFHDKLIHDIYYHGKNKYLTRLMNGLFFKLRFKRIMKRQQLNKSDLLIVSSVEPLIGPIFALKKKYHFKTASTPLEWFPSNFFSNKHDAYIANKMFWHNAKNDILFPISHKIREQFPNNDCLILPCMTDTKEYKYLQKLEGKYIFVFPANGIMKDALSEMVKGILLLSDQDLRKMELHFTGVNEEKLKSIITNEEWERIANTIIVHKWMEYSELVSLYQKAHYLFLARDENQMTQSNFPSKVPETMTYGIVPVVSKVGDYTSYYLENGLNSLIFEGCDSNICRDMFDKAINIPFSDYNRLSRNARKFAEDKFDFRNWSSKMKNIIESVFAEE